MPVAILATGIASAIAAAAGMYARKKKTEQRRDEARLVERLDSIAHKDAVIAPGQRLFVASTNRRRSD